MHSTEVQVRVVAGKRDLYVEEEEEQTAMVEVGTPQIG
jgi:hypothetical protein